MKTFAFAATAIACSLALAGCGKSDSADELANPDNVEMPAEEAMGGIDASVAPVTDAAADASAGASDAAAVPAASEAAAAPAAAPSAAAAKQ